MVLEQDLVDLELEIPTNGFQVLNILPLRRYLIIANIAEQSDVIFQDGNVLELVIPEIDISQIAFMLQVTWLLTSLPISG